MNTNFYCHFTALEESTKSQLLCEPVQNGFSVDSPQRHSHVSSVSSNLCPSPSIKTKSPLTWYGPLSAPKYRGITPNAQSYERPISCLDSLNHAFGANGAGVAFRKSSDDNLSQIAVDVGFCTVRLEPLDYFLVVRNPGFHAFLFIFVFLETCVQNSLEALCRRNVDYVLQ